jgi:hypothetical protein
MLYGLPPLLFDDEKDDGPMGADTSHANTDIGFRTGNGQIASVSGGIGASNGRSFDTQTVLTSLTGDKVNVTTGKNTKLSGAVIAATDTQGNDTGNLNLSTGTLTTENLTDTHYNSATGFSIGANIALDPKVENPKPNTNKSDKTDTTHLRSETLAFNTSTGASMGKTLATLGNGNIHITDTANSTDTTHLNRDVTQTNKDLFSTNTGTSVEAVIDNRIFSEDGKKEIKQNMENVHNALGETYTELSNEAGKFVAETTDYLKGTKLTDTTKKGITSIGTKETFDQTLAKSGLSEEQIKAFQNDPDYKRVFGIKDDKKATDTNNPSNTNSSSNPNDKTIHIEKISVTETLSEASKAKDILVSGANLINKLVDTVGSDNATYAIYATQIAIEGPLKMGMGVLGDALNEKLTGEFKNKATTYIAEEGLYAKEAATKAEEKAIYNISGIGVDLASDIVIGGAASIIRNSNKLTKADNTLIDILEQGGDKSFTVSNGLGEVKAPNPKVTIQEGQTVLLTKQDGLEIRKPGDGTFTNTINDGKTTHLYTVDNEGIKVIPENTSIAGNDKAKHTNISDEAAFGGEATFNPDGSVVLNPYSGRFGTGNSANDAETQLKLDNTKKLFEDLGYTNVTTDFSPKPTTQSAISLKYSNIDKINTQMKERGWTEQDIVDALKTEGILTQGKNGPATRYVNPNSGKSVVVDNSTGEIFHVGDVGYKYDY